MLGSEDSSVYDKTYFEHFEQYLGLDIYSLNRRFYSIRSSTNFLCWSRDFCAAYRFLAFWICIFCYLVRNFLSSLVSRVSSLIMPTLFFLMALFLSILSFLDSVNSFVYPVWLWCCDYDYYLIPNLFLIYFNRLDQIIFICSLFTTRIVEQI